MMMMMRRFDVVSDIGAAIDYIDHPLVYNLVTNESKSGLWSCLLICMYVCSIKSSTCCHAEMTSHDNYHWWAIQWPVNLYSAVHIDFVDNKALYSLHTMNWLWSCMSVSSPVWSVFMTRRCWMRKCRIRRAKMSFALSHIRTTQLRSSPGKPTHLAPEGGWWEPHRQHHHNIIIIITSCITSSSFHTDGDCQVLHSG